MATLRARLSRARRPNHARNAQKRAAMVLEGIRIAARARAALA